MLLALFSGLALATQDAPAPAQQVEDVVVVGVRGGRPPYDVFADFERYCFQPNRTQARAEAPDDASPWAPVESPTVAPAGGGPSFILEMEDLTLLLTIAETDARWGLRRNVCKLSALGAHDPARLERQLASLLNARGSSRHLSHEPDAYPRRPGWRQLIWTSIPAKRSQDWEIPGRGLSSEPPFIVVTEPFFYRSNRYVVVQLETTDDVDARPFSQLSLTHIFRP